MIITMQDIVRILRDNETYMTPDQITAWATDNSLSRRVGNATLYVADGDIQQASRIAKGPTQNDVIKVWAITTGGFFYDNARDQKWGNLTLQEIVNKTLELRAARCNVDLSDPSTLAHVISDVECLLEALILKDDASDQTILGDAIPYVDAFMQFIKAVQDQGIPYAESNGYLHVVFTWYQNHRDENYPTISLSQPFAHDYADEVKEICQAMPLFTFEIDDKNRIEIVDIS